MGEIYMKIDRIISNSKESNPWVTYEKVKKYLRDALRDPDLFKRAIKYTADKLKV